MTIKPNKDLAVMVGRFQPFHNGHATLLHQALAIADQVLIVLGSSFHARSPRNPFTWQERVEMISNTLTAAERSRVSFAPVRDYYEDTLWSNAVRHHVQTRYPDARDVVLVGHDKDDSSYYLRLFPQWHMLDCPLAGNIDATHLRRVMFEAEDIDVSLSVVSDMLPLPVRQYLRAWTLLPHYAPMVAEYRKIQSYQRAWNTAPYPPIFTTVDAVVRTTEHVLLVQRGDYPGKGLWALPGGFLEPRERLLQGAMRELVEETRLAVLQTTLLNCLVDVKVFDHPDRSLRGRTITHAHYFDLRSEHLPDVQGDDDAALARWVEIAELPEMEDQFFDDHFHILNHFLKVVEG